MPLATRSGLRTPVIRATGNGSALGAGGAKTAWPSASWPMLPALPLPTRYVAWNVKVPAGGRPCSPSPNRSHAVPSLSTSGTKQVSAGPADSRSRWGCQVRCSLSLRLTAGVARDVSGVV